MVKQVQIKRQLGNKQQNNPKKGSRKSQNISEFRERISLMDLQQTLKFNPK